MWRAAAVCSLIWLLTACPSAGVFSGSHVWRQPSRLPTSVRLGFAFPNLHNSVADFRSSPVGRATGRTGLRSLAIESNPGPSGAGALQVAHSDSEGSFSDFAGESPQCYPIPVLGAFAVADAEVNVALPSPRQRATRRGRPRAQDAERRRGKRKDKPGFKPTAGLGAMLGFLAAGPAGAIAGATASVVTSNKDNLAGDTVRTAAKAAETLGSAAWDATSKAANAVQVEDFVRKGVDAVDDSVDGFRERGAP